MAKKGNRVQVILECTEHKDSGKPGTSRYITTKNKKNTPERLEVKKFNPILKKMTVRGYELDRFKVIKNAVSQNYLKHVRHTFLESLGAKFTDLSG